MTVAHFTSDAVGAGKPVRHYAITTPQSRGLHRFEAFSRNGYRTLQRERDVVKCLHS